LQVLCPPVRGVRSRLATREMPPQNPRKDVRESVPRKAPAHVESREKENVYALDVPLRHRRVCGDDYPGWGIRLSIPGFDRTHSAQLQSSVFGNVVDQYLAALVARDPKRLPLLTDVKYTENDQVIPIGDGFWKTVEGRGKYTHIFSDPEFGQVAYMAR